MSPREHEPAPWDLDADEPTPTRAPQPPKAPKPPKPPKAPRRTKAPTAATSPEARTTEPAPTRPEPAAVAVAAASADGVAPSAPPRRSVRDRAAALARHPVAQAALFAVLAAAAALASSPGRYVGENRFDQYHAPGRRLLRTLYLWDPTRGMGRTREDLWPLQLAPLSLLRGVGLSAVSAQRVWHALLITVAAAGAAAVVRAVRTVEPVDGADAPEASGDGLAPFVAGLIYGFGPYSVTFLTPANLYTAYAVAPWVALCAWRGGRARDPWPSAAAAALLVASLGNADLPGVVMALLAVPIVAVASARRAGRSWRAGAAWLVRAGVLVVGASAAALWKTAAAASVFTQRLSTTESPAAVGVASSWSETFRGLGFWLSYFRSSELARPQTAAFFTDSAVVLATFVPIVLALVALALPEVRTRVLWGTLLLVGAVVMVGVHPSEDPVPAGRLLLEVFERSGFAAGFRTTYKAGAVMMLAVAVLGGLGAAALARRLGRRGEGRVLFSVGVVGLLAVAALPLWTGGLYDESRTSGEVPAYWYDAARAINDLPGDGRVLILPATTRSIYEWGWVGDDIVDSLITRPHVIDTSVPLSTPEAADIVAAVSEAAHDARYRPGAIAAVLRRLGIDHVVIRNDLDAEATRTIAPNRLGSLRADPSLELVRTFGDRAPQGQGAASSDTRDLDALPAIELYRLAEPGPLGPRVAPAGSALVVSGSGAGMLPLGADGDLDTSGTVRFSGASTADQLASDLEADGRLVLTDSNRRRVTVVSGLVRTESWTLAEGEDLDRPGTSLFETPGSQTVAWYRDATRISSDGAPRTARGAQPWTRPAAAFDGASGTWWQTAELQRQEGITLRVDLREETAIERVRLQPLPAPASATRLTEVLLRFSDGTEVPADLSGGPTTVQVDAGPSSWVEVEITGVADGTPRPVGLREVAFDDLDLREWIALPDDVVRLAEGSPALAEAVEGAPLSITMTRDQPEARFPVEPALRRRVRLPDDREMTVRGLLTPRSVEEAALVSSLRGTCRAEVLEVDGEGVPLTLADSVEEVEPGVAVEVTSCGPVEMPEGWREIEVDAESSLDDLRFDDAPADEVDPVGGAVAVERAAPDRLRVTVDAPEGGVVLTGQSYDERWIARVDGRDLGPARLHDGLSGWEIPPGEDQEVVMEFRPAGRFRIASWISIVTVAICVALLLRRRRRPDQPGAASAVAPEERRATSE